jgi:hypothetical protein
VKIKPARKKGGSSVQPKANGRAIREVALMTD